MLLVTVAIWATGPAYRFQAAEYMGAEKGVSTTWVLLPASEAG